MRISTSLINLHILSSFYITSASHLHSSSANMSSWHLGKGREVVPCPTKEVSLGKLLLHGNLDIWIKEAKNLPNMDLFQNTLGNIFGNLKNKIEGHVPSKATSDPYVTISVCDAVIGRTFVISNSENPVWMQHFHVPVAHYASEVHFVVKDSDVVGSEVMGTVFVPFEQLQTGKMVDGTFPVIGSNGKPCSPGAVLSISIQYTPIEKDTICDNGVPGTYFPLRKGCKATLYQDAHVIDGSLPSLKLDQNVEYQHGKCWRDIYVAIREAHRLVYITGWSVYHLVKLVRDAGDAKDYMLGNLLKNKSQEGVRVLLLVWDDPTSASFQERTTDGIMQTSDEQTKQYFKHSSVQVLLCPRSSGEEHSWAKKREVETIYSHHQKTVMVDVDAGHSKRKIVSFLGGLDLCNGRYDTPGHHLFRTLQTVHKDDFHNPNFMGSADGCPREPWHDLHCRIEGQAAYDILTNFEERWRKASRRRGLKKLKESHDDSLLNRERISDLLPMEEALLTKKNDPEEWYVQVFRSIDSTSVQGFPKDSKDATRMNLVCGKNILIDMSIHTAYVKAIRSAQHFIYIENQYFLGSSYNWNSFRDLGANNLIPMEIALKIANKIRAKERFSVYIIVPMWPEGVPASSPTQRILYWQNQTMQMMYDIIYNALEEVGLEKEYEPQDFLNFFCLGNREAADTDENAVAGNSNAASAQMLARRNRRFMIYVHSKGMIVDDEYVLLGSANINQRSMDGTRDTEIAMGAYQPHYTWAKKGSSPQSQVYGYRMSLWAEHLGKVEDCFNRPESLECIRQVRSIGERNWRQYAADEVTEMKGHLLKYPVEVDRKGNVKPLPGAETFPDLDGRIVGTFMPIQENITI